MIKLEDAQKVGFRNTTRAEFRKYAEELGIDNVAPNADSKTLKKAVFNALGLAMNPEQTAADNRRMKVTSTRGSDAVLPSYNLTPNGIWQGRRHRMSIPRPEGSKHAAAEGFSWNGKHTYYIPYDEIDNVPEPIYQLIITNKRRRPKMVVPDGAGMGEVTTGWEFDSAPMTYLGVDPETQNRAGSLMEWYQSRGSEWFDKLDLRQMQLICAKCDISTTRPVGGGVPPAQLNEEDLRARMLEFFFGYADAHADPNTEIEA